MLQTIFGLKLYSFILLFFLIMTVSGLTLSRFVEYCWSFYNPQDGIYPIRRLTHKMLFDGCKVCAELDSFCDGDSVDRETVRDYVLKWHDVEWID